MKDIHFYMIILYMIYECTTNHFSQNLSKKLAFGHSEDIIEWGLAEGAARGCRPSFFCHQGLGRRAQDAQVFGLHWPPTTRASSIDLHDNIWQFIANLLGPSTVTMTMRVPPPLHVTFFWSHPILTVQDFHQWDEKACVAIHRCLLTALQKW